MRPPSRTARRRTLRAAALLAPATAILLFTAQAAYANVAVTQASHDIYTDAQAQHNSEVEPDTFAFGSTIVSAFQVGRVFGGGASNVGWATSTNGGATWTHGYLPGITTNAGGTFPQVSDASVGFDAAHNVWLISTIGINGSSVVVLTSRSTDGGLTWGAPITTATGSNDKNWIVCDNTAASPFFGHCYTEYDISGSGDALRMKTSTDGGLTAQRHRDRAVPVVVEHHPLVPLRRRRCQLAGDRAGRVDQPPHGGRRAARGAAALG
jgi:hypothetical protein